MRVENLTVGTYGRFIVKRTVSETGDRFSFKIMKESKK